VGALKNLQIVLHIVISDCFENCFEAFIDNLEAIYRPMELVSLCRLSQSLHSKKMVEITLRRFFRVVRSVKTSSTQQSCVQKCTEFDKVIAILSNHPSMIRQEVFFGLRDARQNEAAAADRMDTAKAEPSKTAICQIRRG
jgi:hypothetical protein